MARRRHSFLYNYYLGRAIHNSFFTPKCWDVWLGVDPFKKYNLPPEEAPAIQAKPVSKETRIWGIISTIVLMAIPVAIIWALAVTA